jgi:hypothetical protein
MSLQMRMNLRMRMAVRNHMPMHVHFDMLLVSGAAKQPPGASASPRTTAVQPGQAVRAGAE